MGDAESIARHGLGQRQPEVLRAALVALDQMPGSKLAADANRPRLNSTNDSELKETLLWIAGRHPEWGDKLADYFPQENLTASRANRPWLKTSCNRC